MENPLELPVPDDPIEKIHALARDIAFGAAQKRWTAHLKVINAEQEGIIADNGLNNGLKPKWGDSPNHYSVHLLTSFGYLARSTSASYLNQGEAYYDITEKAFSLLGHPATPSSVFISYKRGESSAFGLLIEARLKLVDSNIGVFIDKLLEPGDKWHAQLEERVRQSRYFVCLLGPKSLGSIYVRNEIRWALDEADHSDTVIIPICHNRYSVGAELSDELGTDAAEIKALLPRLSVNNAIIVNPESAEAYELAIMKLLNKLGYSNI
ncbi:MAG: toll/interleukin-1 receptor domain-containing protein [Anaerolineae bacterium]|nr:toll/interleukin-1 receptor domain-containing protein [Anaerolineae bacterium]